MQVFEGKDWEQLLARSVLPKLAFALQVSNSLRNWHAWGYC